ncbi:MAG: NADH-quinone oxidoreductase subunit L [Vicinamibacteria bacterium]|nr:NADH-quinone oxidoreductase subunit L [Vicinamibacteria bacterium]
MLALIPLLPFAGFLVNALFGKRLPKSVSGGVACAAMIAAFGVSLFSVTVMFGTPGRAIEQTVYTWIASGDLHIGASFYVDALASVMILVITGIGSLIHIYSTAYMHDESGSEFARYFSYLNLFAAFMLVLVLGSNFPVMFVGWEGVGLCSYLLIGFWYRKQSAIDAGKKAFVVNRIGDFAFILGTLLVFSQFGTLDFQGVASKAAALPVETGWGVLSVATLLLFIGATGKSAQIPLFTWLPDAMEGPTPVSALIHAATMVTAGVYMIGRNAVLFSHAPETLQVVAIIGAATALLAGTIGIVQNDIKRVLAYSTVSQLGYMFLAMGVGAYGAGIFHLYTHAFFKALLFLGSGAVIHALHGEQDLRHMGGLKKELPITYWTFLIGAIAIAGVPGLAGFFSKDEILWKTFEGGHTLLWVVGILTALLTATYMFRLVFLAFHGERRGLAPVHHAGARPQHLHDAPPAMATALIVLAIGSVVAGYVGVPAVLGGSNTIEHYLAPSFEARGGVHELQGLGPAATAEGVPHGADGAVPPAAEGGAPRVSETSAPHGGAAAHESTELSLMGVSIALAFAGIGLAWFFFVKSPGSADGVASAAGPLHTLLLNKYYIDELYDAVIVKPIVAISRGVLWKVVDAEVIDGAVNGTGSVVETGATWLRRFQTGSVRVYAASILLGVVLVLGYYMATF